MTKQLFGNPKALGVAAGLLATMGLIPGMPNLAFLFMAALCGAAAYAMAKRRAHAAAGSCRRRQTGAAPTTRRASCPGTTSSRWTSSAWKWVTGWCRSSTSVRAAICWRACAACAASSRRISASWFRRCTSATTSISRPTSIASIWAACRSAKASSIRIASWRSTRDGCSARSRASPPRIRPSAWMRSGSSPSARDHAQTLGYTVVDPSTVIATHLSFIIQAHAHEMLGHEEVQQLLNTLAKTAPKLVEDLVPRVVPLSALVRVLQGLLAERVPIRNMRTIIETIAEHAPKTQDAAVLQGLRARRARPADRAGHRRRQRRAARHHSRARSRKTAAGITSRQRRQPRSGARFGRAIATTSGGGRHGVKNPPVSRRCCSCHRHCVTHLRGFTRSSVPNLHVLAWNEIPDNRKVRLVSAVGR